MAFQFGPSGSLEDVSAVEFDGQSVDEIVLDGTSVWTSVEPLGASSSFLYPSGATSGWSSSLGEPQPPYIPDLSVGTDTLSWPSVFGGGNVYFNGSFIHTDDGHGFGSGGVAIEGDVAAVITPVMVGGSFDGNGVLFIYERNGGNWEFAASFFHDFQAVAGQDQYDTGFQKTHIGGFESCAGSGLVVQNGRVFVSLYSGSGEISVTVLSNHLKTNLSTFAGPPFNQTDQPSDWRYSSTPGTYDMHYGDWSEEASIHYTNSHPADIKNADSYLDQAAYEITCMSVHGGILAVGLPGHPGDTHYVDDSEGVVAIYEAPSSNQWWPAGCERGRMAYWTDWLSPGAAVNDRSGFWRNLEVGFSVAVRDGRVTGGPTVVAAGANHPYGTSTPVFYWISDSSGNFTHRAGTTVQGLSDDSCPWWSWGTYALSHPNGPCTAAGQQSPEGSGIVEPSGAIPFPGAWTTTTFERPRVALGGWGNDIFMLVVWRSSGPDAQIWQLSSSQATFEHVQDIDNNAKDTSGGAASAEWASGTLYDESMPDRRAYAVILADRMIYAAGINGTYITATTCDRHVLMREQSGQGGSTAAIVQGDFMESFGYRIGGSDPAPGYPGSVVANFEGYVNEQLASYWSANEASLLATYGSKRNWGEVHWYTTGIKEGRPMKYQQITLTFPGIGIYEG